MVFSDKNLKNQMFLLPSFKPRNLGCFMSRFSEKKEKKLFNNNSPNSVPAMIRQEKIKIDR